MYELIVLSLLMTQPLHGYLIGKIMNNIVGPFAKISNGRLYPLLVKLEESGLIEVVADLSEEPENGRPTRNFRITDRGRERFHALMLDTSSNPGDYQRLFLNKVDAWHFLTLEERLQIIDHYITFCQGHLQHITAVSDNWLYNAKRISSVQHAEAEEVMLHMRDQWELELAWAKRLREKFGQ